MPEMTIVQAVNSALHHEMGRDESVVCLGQDVGKAGGVFRCTVGLQEKFGKDRCFDTPLAESGIIGFAIGMAVTGMKSVPEIQFLDFIMPALDQALNEAAKIRYRSGGQYTCPMTIRAPYGGGIKGGHYHSQSLEVIFAHTPGIKVVVPSNPYDTKGLLLSAIRDPDPVLFMEPKRIYRTVKSEVPEGEYTVPIGEAKVVKEGKDLSIFTYGSMLHVVMQAVEKAEAEGRSVEVVDLRTISPLDEATVLRSAKKTGRVVTVTEAPSFCNFGSEISAMIAEQAIEYMDAPIVRVAGFDTPFPYALENYYLPSPNRILNAIDQVME